MINPAAGNAPTVGGGHLTLPVIQGDNFGDRRPRRPPAGRSHGLVGGDGEDRPRQHQPDGEAAGLALINRQNPNHFLKTTLQYKDDTNPDQGGNQPGKWAERVLTANGNAVTLPPATVPWPNSGALTRRRLRLGALRP